jgi:hypothetical protein
MEQSEKAVTGAVLATSGAEAVVAEKEELQPSMRLL